MKLIGLISPNLSEDTLVDVYKMLPEGIRIEGRALNVGKYTDDEFNRAEQAFSDLVRDLARRPLDFLMITVNCFSLTRVRARTARSSTWSNKSHRHQLRQCSRRLSAHVKRWGSSEW
jgi:hypothetical protein